MGGPNNPSSTRRTIGAAVVAPWPPCSTMATTTYLGWFAGAMAANHENGCSGTMSAVPVFPATGIRESGKPEKAADAVPDTVTPDSAVRRNAACLPEMGRWPVTTGSIVRTSWPSAVSTFHPTWGAYSASKAALHHLSRIWDAELASERVRVLSTDPGDMDTPMHALAVPDADPVTLKRPEDAAREMLALIAGAFPRLSEQTGETARGAA